MFHDFCHKGAGGLECNKVFLNPFWGPICVKYQIDLQKKREGKEWMEKSALRRVGGVRGLMAKVMQNVHFLDPLPIGVYDNPQQRQL